MLFPFFLLIIEVTMMETNMTPIIDATIIVGNICLPSLSHYFLSSFFCGRTIRYTTKARRTSAIFAPMMLCPVVKKDPS